MSIIILVVTEIVDMKIVSLFDNESSVFTMRVDTKMYTIKSLPMFIVVLYVTLFLFGFLYNWHQTTFVCI